ncbi:MAG: MTAP family purine nucleoside phosphorylase [Deltaproteobacteria bacterium]|nr:MTAP family purine nucleoside phosphorylase [Deltaproteobacteria bacterium]
MKSLGLIAGTVFFGMDWFLDVSEKIVETPFGSASVFCGERVVFIPRHGKDETNYIMPHRINHSANFSALRNLGVEAVVGVHSTGSLKSELVPGSIVIPDDFISLFNVPSIFQDRPGHVTPLLDQGLQAALFQAGRRIGAPIVAGGTYWQNTGPRLETKAEIRLLSQFADLVGMTMGSEATIAVEMGIPYASVCSVDNYAHGVADVVVSEAAIREGAGRNASTITRILEQFLDHTTME